MLDALSYRGPKSAAVLASAVLVVGAKALPPAPTQEWSAGRLSEFVRVRKLRSVESVLAALPPSALAEYTLVRESRSLQAGTPASPRVLVYSRSGRFVFSFNSGDAKKRGFNTLEMMQFDDNDKTFAFSRIQFPAPIEAAQARGDESEVQFSEKNPRACMACHDDSSPRPNWEPFDRWPGLYGARGDTVPPGSAEARSLASFLAAAEDHPRYKRLPRLSARYRLSDDGRLAVPTNRVLTQRLAPLNYQRIARLLRETDGYEAWRIPVVAAGLRCVDPARGRPAAAYFGRRGPPADFDEAMLSSPSSPDSELSAGSEGLTDVRTLLSALVVDLEVDPSNWSMAFRYLKRPDVSLKPNRFDDGRVRSLFDGLFLFGLTQDDNDFPRLGPIAAQALVPARNAPSAREKLCASLMDLAQSK